MSQDEFERMLRLLENYDQLTRILLGRPNVAFDMSTATFAESVNFVVAERLRIYGGNITKTAKSLGISKVTVHRYIEKELDRCLEPAT